MVVPLHDENSSVPLRDENSSDRDPLRPGSERALLDDLIVRRVRVRPEQVVFLKGVIDASEGLAAVFAERSQFGFEGRRFEQVYAELERALYDGRCVSTVVAPLLGVALDESTNELGSKVPWR